MISLVLMSFEPVEKIEIGDVRRHVAKVSQSTFDNCLQSMLIERALNEMNRGG